ncbi:myelin protein zero-like protein 3 [Erpetoichthys calabaricus]|uniref:Myelin protein zero like 3 n=1 Tax=Erpetoichthys calabaricus TaxID=27687 RepID=A0A8C4SME7_ERPCA|nr:myelin protein zero-like protein 3 [Erpetoichthys calabaricus]
MRRILYLTLLLGSFALPGCHAITIDTDVEVTGSAGDDITLKCTFKSSAMVTSQLSIDWSYRPVNGKTPQMVFHYQEEAFPPTDGQFKDRIHWRGDINKRDASIQIRNASLSDNGTFTCSVRNPPDVHGSLGETTLTVTPKGWTFSFTEFTLLASLVLIPSALTLIVLALIIGYQNDLLCKRRSLGYRTSPIEVSEEEENLKKKPSMKKRMVMCCAECFQESDYEEDDANQSLQQQHHHHHHHVESHEENGEKRH